MSLECLTDVSNIDVFEFFTFILVSHIQIEQGEYVSKIKRSNAQNLIGTYKLEHDIIAYNKENHNQTEETLFPHES